MKRNAMIIITMFALILASTLPAVAGYEYKANKEHLGGNITPIEAYRMIQKDPAHTFLVDCRTQAEYQLIGHPVASYNIPLRFFSDKVGEKGYLEVDNPDFGKDLLARFNPETDTLIIFCRSGNRSCVGCNEAIKAGFKEEKVFNMMGGFEGDKNKNKESSYYDKRWAGGWKLEGLPWTYSMDHKYMYQPDVKKASAAVTFTGKRIQLSKN
jgi:rhodanese-related sulfurtransferase